MALTDHDNEGSIAYQEQSGRDGHPLYSSLSGSLLPTHSLTFKVSLVWVGGRKCNCLASEAKGYNPVS